MNKLIGFIVITFVVGSIVYLEARKPERVAEIEVISLATTTTLVTGTSSSSFTTEPPTPVVSKPVVSYLTAKEIVSPAGFINTTSDFKLADLIGKKVILVDFWTYSCINCQRTQPYLNAWYEKYQNLGLEIVGIHTPEFNFEKSLANVEQAVSEAGIKYPVVLDNDYGTWTAYANRFWPRKYLVNKEGYIVYDHIGEGAYNETERKIQELLGVNVALTQPTLSVKEIGGFALTPEIYLGSARSKAENNITLDGSWRIDTEFLENLSADASLTVPYTAKNVFMVAGADLPTKVKVYQDEVFIKEILIQEETLYTLIEGSVPVRHNLRLFVDNPGFRIFTFTFG